MAGAESTPYIHSPISDEAVAKVLPSLHLDARVSLAVHRGVFSRNWLRLFASFVTLTADEAVFFPLLAIFGFVCYFASGFFGERAFGVNRAVFKLAGARMLRAYGDFGALCLIEQVLKLLCRRDRPFYALVKKRPFYAMPGEWFSFPSGHSMRVAYSVVLFTSAEVSFLTTLGLVAEDSYEANFALWMVWVAVVAWSRVALAKHFISDVVVGVGIGFALASSPMLTMPSQGVLRMAAAAAFSIEAVAIALSPHWRTQIRGWAALLMINVGFWVSFPFSATQLP